MTSDTPNTWIAERTERPSKVEPIAGHPADAAFPQSQCRDEEN